MSDGFDLRITGDRDLVAQLMALDLAPQKVLEAATQAAAEVMRAAAADMAPGPEIEKQTIKKASHSCQVDIAASKEKWYYNFFETGAGSHAIAGKPLLVFEGADGRIATRVVDHPGMAARPFLRPAFDGEQQRAADALGDAIARAIRTVAE